MLSKLVHPFILCYHQISKSRFCGHVQFLKKNFEVVPLKELLAEVFEREGRSPRRLVALTMDDCYEQDFVNAKAVCEGEQVHCTFFLPVEYALNAKCFWAHRLKVLFGELALTIVDEERRPRRLGSASEKSNLLSHYLTTYNRNEVQTDAIEQMVDSLFENNRIIERKLNPILSIGKARQAINEFVSFESHSMTHPKLTLCTNSEVATELMVSKRAISELLASESRLFCYPYGCDHHIGESWKQAREAYDYGLTLRRGLLNQRSNPMLLPRIDLYEGDNLFRMRAKIISALRQ